jgi:LPXTG-motif cell wall-anchored protein
MSCKSMNLARWWRNILAVLALVALCGMATSLTSSAGANEISAESMEEEASSDALVEAASEAQEETPSDEMDAEETADEMDASSVEATSSDEGTTEDTSGGVLSAAVEPPGFLPVGLTEVTLPTVYAGDEFSYQIEATGDPVFSRSGGGSPCWDVTVSESGLISGVGVVDACSTTPVRVTVRAQNAGGDAFRTYFIPVHAAPSISGEPSDGVVGEAYDFGFNVGGYNGTYAGATVRTAKGQLPEGVELVQDGLESVRLKGVPTESGVYPFTLSADNGTGSYAILETSLTIDELTAPTISGTPTDATRGEEYEFAFTVTGSPEPTVTVESDSRRARSTGTGLPAGLSLSPSGVISGTPTEQGTFTLRLTATNGIGDDATLETTITVIDLAAAGSADVDAPVTVMDPVSMAGADDDTALANTGMTVGFVALALSAVLLGLGAILVLRRRHSDRIAPRS